MKKAILLMLFPLLFLNGCGKKEDINENIEKTEMNTEIDVLDTENESNTDKEDSTSNASEVVDPKVEAQKLKAAKKVFDTDDFVDLPLYEYSYPSVKLPSDYEFDISYTDKETGKDKEVIITGENITSDMLDTSEIKDVSIYGADGTDLNISVTECMDGVIPDLESGQKEYTELNDRAFYCKDPTEVYDFFLYYQKEHSNLLTVKYESPKVNEKDYDKIAKEIYKMIE